MTCPGLIVAVGSTLCCLLSSPVRLTAEAAQVTDRPSSGTIRSTITLAGHSLTVDFTPRPVPTFTAERSAGLIPRRRRVKLSGTLRAQHQSTLLTRPGSRRRSCNVGVAFGCPEAVRCERGCRLKRPPGRRSIPLSWISCRHTAGTELLNVSLTPIGDRSASFVLAWHEQMDNDIDASTKQPASAEGCPR